jgi:hypothetical protein
MSVGVGKQDASECHVSYVNTKIGYFLDTDAIVSRLRLNPLDVDCGSKFPANN